MSEIRILVDCHVFDQSLQGTTTYITGLYTELIKDKTKNFYFISHSFNLEELFGKHENVKYIKFKSANKFYRLLIELPQIIKKYKIDYAHFQYIMPPLKYCKYIVTTHDILFVDYPQYFPFLTRLKNNILFKWSAKKSDIVLTVSEYSKRKIEEHFGIKNIYITTNAVSEEFFEAYDKVQIQSEIEKKYGLSDYIIYVSRWEPRKMHDLVLKSFVRLKLYEKYNLLFIGDTSFLNEKYDEFHEKLDGNIKNKIFSFKKVDFKSMLQLLRGAKASVYPSIAEGFGIPPLESIAAKIPTITSNVTAMADFKFLSEYSFNPQNESEFEEKLLEILSFDESKMPALTESLKNQYSWEKSAKIFNQALDDNLNSNI